MNKNTITLNEEQLRSLIENCVTEVLNEGPWDRIKAMYRGAKNGYQGQRFLDRGSDNFKQQHDAFDYRRMAGGGSVENTAEMQAKEIYDLYKKASGEAMKYLNLYNQMIRKYNLKKNAVGDHRTTEKPIVLRIPGKDDINFSASVGDHHYDNGIAK